MSRDEKLKVVMKVIEIGIRTTFRNHVYQWEGKFYVQREGGPIGLKLVGVVAKLRMIHWMRQFNAMLVENEVKTYMNTVYVDDQSWAGRALRRGVRWDSDSKSMRWESR